VTGNELGHLEHADLLLAIEHGLERVVGVDEGPFLGVLKLVFLDVVPVLFGELGARQWLGAYYFREFGIGLNRFQERCVWFSFCGFGGFRRFRRFFHGPTLT